MKIKTISYRNERRAWCFCSSTCPLANKKTSPSKILIGPLGRQTPSDLSRESQGRQVQTQKWILELMFAKVLWSLTLEPAAFYLGFFIRLLGSCSQCLAKGSHSEFSLYLYHRWGGGVREANDSHKLPSWANTEHRDTFIQIWRVRQFSLVLFFTFLAIRLCIMVKSDSSNFRNVVSLQLFSTVFRYSSPF